MKFIGISGPIASGKTALGSRIKTILEASGYITAIIPFAKGVKYLASLENVEDRSYMLEFFLKEIGADNIDRGIAELNKAFEMYPTTKNEKNRKLLQYIGSEVGRETLGKDTWINAVKLYAKNSIWPLEFVISDDMRFINESQFVDFHVAIDTDSTPEYVECYKKQCEQFDAAYLYSDHVSEKERLLLDDPHIIVPVGFDQIDVLLACSLILNNV